MRSSTFSCPSVSCQQSWSFDDMRLLFCILMICGVAVAVQPTLRNTGVVALWSDFKAFEGKVAALEDGEEILSIGGENGSETFADLLRKLWNLHREDNYFSPVLGIFIFFLSAYGLGLEISREGRRSKAVETQEGAGVSARRM